MTISHYFIVRNFEVICEEQWQFSWRTILNMTFKLQKLHYFLLNDTKRSKWQIICSLEFENLRLFVMNRWRFTWRTITNTPITIKNFTIWPIVHTNFEVKKRIYNLRNSRNSIFLSTLKFNFDVICEEKVTSHMKTVLNITLNTKKLKYFFVDKTHF
jgi:hypothetical protein